MGDFTPTGPDFTGGVKSETHRRQWAFYGFYGFYGFSLEGGRVCARPRTRDLPPENRRKIRKIRKVGLLSCGQDFTLPELWRKIRCKIGGGSGE